MNLFEEFRLYERLWQSVGAAQALWVNSDGVEIDLADPVAFDNELTAEKARYQHDLRKRLVAQDQNLLAAIRRCMNGPRKMTMAEVLDDWITSHVKNYEVQLKHTRDILHVNNDNLPAITQQDINTVIKLYNRYYDIAKEKELIEYIDAKMRIKGRLGKPALLARAKAEKAETIRMLAKSGHGQLADVAKTKFDEYIKQFESALGATE